MATSHPVHYSTPRRAIRGLVALDTPQKVAGDLGVHNAHIYRAMKGDFTPTLIKRLKELDYIPGPRRRYRRCIEFDTAEEAAEFDGLLSNIGMDRDDLRDDIMEALRGGAALF